MMRNASDATKLAWTKRGVRPGHVLPVAVLVMAGTVVLCMLLWTIFVFVAAAFEAIGTAVEDFGDVVGEAAAEVVDRSLQQLATEAHVGGWLLFALWLTLLTTCHRGRPWFRLLLDAAFGWATLVGTAYGDSEPPANRESGRPPTVSTEDDSSDLAEDAT